eukprot:67780-Pyramimonas_sp.AAC.1
MAKITPIRRGPAGWGKAPGRARARAANGPLLFFPRPKPKQLPQVNDVQRRRDNDAEATQGRD